jgi:multiple sugar transport system permease protein
MMALGFYHKLRWGKWIADAELGGVPVSDLDISNGYVKSGKRRIEFSNDDVIKGVARTHGTQRGLGSFDLLGRGEVAMTFANISDLSTVGSDSNIDPSLLSWFPIPAAPVPNGQRVVQTYNHYASMYTGVGDRPKSDRDAVWKTLTAICDESVVDNEITSKVLQGLSRFVAPDELRRMGYEEYIRDIPVALLRNFDEIENHQIKSRTEPWSGFWIIVDSAINRECISLMLGANGEDFDYELAMQNVEDKANSGLMFDTPREVLDKWRPLARVILVVFIVIFIFLGIKIVKSSATGSGGGVHKGWLPVLMVLPAILIILFWRYYPLLRGMVMAFQDYKIAGSSDFVGLDNFIILAGDKSFWMSFLRTGQFVFLNMIFAFTAPIFLALLLSEAPRFKIFFRTLFFLPQMTSGIVIALMWKLMYNPTPAGFLNQLLAMLNHLPFVNIASQTWLEDPQLAMICCVLPTVWASMGMASLIYLAALHSIPPDLYEAVDIDGGGIRAKLRNITLPSLLPLIIINFVGTFIATFQNMGNIFLLTFGGPGETTMVVGLKIWIEAYTNLRFSMATSMAWILGSLLIGLTYVQIQFLGKVEYKRAKD